MRVAALYDIHGNLPALEAVLQEIAQANVELLVVGGDVVTGPMPRETLACLRNLTIPVQFIQGNADREVLAHMTGLSAGAVPEHVRAITRWVAQQLQTEHARFIAGWPATLQLGIPGLDQVLFCHATPRSDTALFTRLTPEARLVPVFEGLNVAVVVGRYLHLSGPFPTSVPQSVNFALNRSATGTRRSKRFLALAKCLRDCAQLVCCCCSVTARRGVKNA
jgi:hypothetical protein